MKFLSVLLLCLSFQSVAFECSTAYKFTPTQKEALQYAYNRGEAHQLGFSMAAITYQESAGGIYLINYKDPSASQFHILAKTALSYEGLKDTDLNRNFILTKLLLNRDYAGDIALHVLIEDRKRFKKNYFNTWAAYNGGPSWSSKEPEVRQRAVNYANSIKSHVTMLTNCFSVWYE